MKSQKGITLISVSISVVVLLIMVAVISVITSYFFSNYNDVSEEVPSIQEYTKFISYFSQDANRKGAKVLLCENNVDSNNKKTSLIVFNNDVQYTFLEENNAIYYNKIKIARNVYDCIFTLSNDKTQINVSIRFLDNPTDIRDMKFILKD